jgi:hypothetical protein
VTHGIPTNSWHAPSGPSPWHGSTGSHFHHVTPVTWCQGLKCNKTLRRSRHIQQFPARKSRHLVRYPAFTIINHYVQEAHTAHSLHAPHSHGSAVALHAASPHYSAILTPAAESTAADIASGSAGHSRSSETLCFCYQE